MLRSTRKVEDTAIFNPDMCFYAWLGVSRDATDVDLKRAYRRCSARVYPNHNIYSEADELRFRNVDRAYQVLSDPGQRAVYDLGGMVGLDKAEKEQLAVMNMFFGSRSPTQCNWLL
eukprot:TRINITY_DN14491_c0_g1_i1.p1 TRINITY_DN14491_c0_g1~~TRINITY_DN14491_c0_g1_i1.p1  ORF type:complete len:116 (-),score=2.45 TRINITY_DN14491_c0_g1_i1:100-447(-)